MAKTRDSNQITATDLPGVITDLNFLLQRMADRIDKLEGLRDTFLTVDDASVEGVLTVEGLQIKDSTGTVVQSTT